MLRREKSREANVRARWPNLRHKYRQLALPAVVAAVMAEKKKANADADESRGEADEKKR